MSVPAHNRQLGFTLIEIVVVVGIMGILLMIGVSSYGTMNDRAKVEQAANGLSTQLRTWQKQVESGIGSGECAGAVFGGLEVSPSENRRTIQAKVICGGVTVGSSMDSAIANGCTTELFDTFDIKPLGQGFSPATTITIINPNVPEIAYSVSLSLSGGIDVKKVQ